MDGMAHQREESRVVSSARPCAGPAGTLRHSRALGVRISAGIGLLALVGSLVATPAQAATVTVDCSKKASINAELAKLDKFAVNVLVVSGICVEDVVIDGHRDLTIRRVDPTTGYYLLRGSSNQSSTVVTVRGASKVTFDRAAIDGGWSGVSCEDRSTCRFTGWVTIGANGGVGIAVQNQSTLDVIDSDPVRASTVSMIDGRALGVFGNSSANLNFNGAPPSKLGHFASSYGRIDIATVQDGSFLRVDRGLFESARGVVVQRGAVAKIINTEIRITGPSDLLGPGIYVLASTLQFEGTRTITGSSDPIVIDALSFARVAGTGTSPLEIISTSTADGKFAVTCAHGTAVAQLANVTLGANGTNCVQ